MVGNESEKVDDSAHESQGHNNQARFKPEHFAVLGAGPLLVDHLKHGNLLLASKQARDVEAIHQRVSQAALVG